MKLPPLRSKQNRPVSPDISLGQISLVSARATPDGARNWTVSLEIGGADLFSAGEAVPPELTPRNFRLERLDGQANLSLVITAVKWVQPPTLLQLSLFMDARAEELENLKYYQHILRLIDFPGHTLDRTASSAPIFLLQSKKALSSDYQNGPEPVFDYTAKDFESIRSLMITNIERFIPNWHEITAADTGTMIVEILAYIADYLSYRQDFVGNEAYLQTALLGTSIDRHARLLGYFAEAGCAPRTVLTFEVSEPLRVPSGTAVLSSHHAHQRRFVTRNSDLFHRSLSGGATCYETRHALMARPGLNRLRIHDFGLSEFTLFAGATDVIAEFPDMTSDEPVPLKIGDVIVLQHISDTDLLPQATSSDFLRAHAVRLTDIEKLQHPAGSFSETTLVSLRWQAQDALPQDLRVTIKPSQPGSTSQTVAAIFANAVEAEYGLTRDLELTVSDQMEADDWQPSLPALPLQSLSDHENGTPLAMSEFLSAKPEQISYPAIKLTDSPLFGPSLSAPDQIWHPTRDLLRHDGSDRVFKLDRNEDRSVTLRFGRNGMGRTPSLSRRYTAHIREAVGSAASVGANVLTVAAPPDKHFSDFATRLIRVNNPLPATATISEESRESVRIRSADMLQDDRLCVTLEDYRRFACSLTDVRDANCWIVGNEPWPYIHIAILARHSNVVDDTLTLLVKQTVAERRPIGRRLIVTGPKPVPLQICLKVLPAEGYATTNLDKKIVAAIGDTERGEDTSFFSRQKTGFGQILYANQLLAFLSNIDGIANIKLTSFRRLDTTGPAVNEALIFTDGEIPLLGDRVANPEDGRLLIEFEERTMA